MTTDTLGGVWSYAIELARGLQARGVQVILATLGGHAAAAQKRQARAVPGLILHESRYRLEWMSTSPWRDVDRAEPWLRRLELRYRPDVVHLNHYSHGHCDWQAPSLVVGHSCVCSWWRAVHGSGPPAEWDPYRARVQRGLQGADAVAAPSQAMLEALQREHGPLARARVIPNGRAAADYPPGAKQPFVLAAGRLWDAGKNLEVLARVAPSLGWPVYVAGEARHPDGQDAEIPDVHGLGCLTPEALRGWYGQASIYVLPARYEPFGLSVLEAGLAGCALVLGDIPSLRELWQGAAVFVPPGDPQRLGAALERIRGDDRYRRTLARRARQRALQYGADTMARRYIELYDGLLCGRGLVGRTASIPSG